MNFDSLMKEKEEQFEKISDVMKAKAEQHQSEMAELQEELLRLQGEYRLLAQLKEESNDSMEKVEAETIED